MSSRFYLGLRAPDDAVIYDAVGTSGKGLRVRSLDFPGPFRLTVGAGVRSKEVRDFFADGEYPQAEDFWMVYLRGQLLEHPSMEALLAVAA